jgi:hypothetical protein
MAEVLFRISTPDILDVSPPFFCFSFFGEELKYGFG